MKVSGLVPRRARRWTGAGTTTKPHGLSVNYEDWKPGWETPTASRTVSDLTPASWGAVLSVQKLAGMARRAREPPILVCTPEYYHSLQVSGHWSLPDRSTPTLAWLDDQIGGLVNFYRDQVDERPGTGLGLWRHHAQLRLRPP